jgi:hypothetical protein
VVLVIPVELVQQVALEIPVELALQAEQDQQVVLEIPVELALQAEQDQQAALAIPVEQALRAEQDQQVVLEIPAARALQVEQDQQVALAIRVEQALRAVPALSAEQVELVLQVELAPLEVLVELAAPEAPDPQELLVELWDGRLTIRHPSSFQIRLLLPTCHRLRFQQIL